MLHKVKDKFFLSRYLFMASISTLVLVILSHSLLEAGIFIAIAAATVVNQLMLCIAVILMTDPPHSAQRSASWAIPALMVGKVLILFLSFAVGVHFVADRIILPVLNYIAQLMALAVSLKRTSLKRQ